MGHGQEQSQEWDDIHFGGADDLPPVTANLDDDLESRTFGTDEGLEASANKTDDDMPLIPPAVDPNAPEPPATPEPVVPTSDNMSGIELYLAQFDIEAGQIQFEDGTSKHFNELDAAKQAEVLQQLHGAQASAIEDKYGLDETEIGLLNYLRTNNLSVEQMVDQMVAEKVATMTSLQEMAAQDYAKMDADALYLKWLKDTSPEATPEQLASDLTKAKELSNFNKLTETLRTQFTKEQQETINAKTNEQVAAHSELIESQRQEIVDAVTPMTELAGIALDQNIKNTVLDHILEVNEEGDSAFMDEVFADPQSLFRAAFWYVYGEALVQQRDEYWKKEKSAAYKRGQEDALGKNTPAQGRSFTTKPATKPTPQQTRTNTRAQEEGDDWLDLHN
jgi:hypothetical protein